MILIAGDSWGCGEWDNGYPTGTGMLLHDGLTKYLRDEGHPVINISQGGQSPREIVGNIRCFFKSGCLEFLPMPIKNIFVFQTDYTRDFYNDSTWQIKNPDQFIKDWYRQLSNEALKYKVFIYIIGGCSDALWVDEFDKIFPNVQIACQSFTNLLVNNTHRIEQPVYMVDPRNDHVKKSNRGTNFELAQSIDLIDKALSRRKLWEDHAQWFYPDSQHPNRHGHRKLYDFLKEYNFV